MCDFEEAKGDHFSSGAGESLFLEEALGRTPSPGAPDMPLPVSSCPGPCEKHRQWVKTNHTGQGGCSGLCAFIILSLILKTAFQCPEECLPRVKLRVCLGIARLLNGFSWKTNAGWTGCGLTIFLTPCWIFTWRTYFLILTSFLVGSFESSCHLGLFCVLSLSQGRSRWMLWASSLFRYSMLRT